MIAITAEPATCRPRSMSSGTIFCRVSRGAAAGRRGGAGEIEADARRAESASGEEGQLMVCHGAARSVDHTDSGRNLIASTCSPSSDAIAISKKSSAISARLIPGSRMNMPGTCRPRDMFRQVARHRSTVVGDKYKLVDLAPLKNLRIESSKRWRTGFPDRTARPAVPGGSVRLHAVRDVLVQKVLKIHIAAGSISRRCSACRNRSRKSASSLCRSRAVRPHSSQSSKIFGNCGLV